MTGSSPAVLTRQALSGIKVVDAATLMAAPLVATIMADHGADVLKIEHPKGDTVRSLGWQRDGYSLWWALVNRNKRCVTLNLSHASGQELLKRLLLDADVFIENFRPGTLERWNIGPDVLRALNPRLVIVRTTAFGQTGPYAQRPGFGTLAESMSGFAQINGWPDGPPTLPPFGLADGIAALTGAYAVMFALWWREHGGNGCGQVIDLSIYEPLFWLLGPQVLVYDQVGVVQGRTGNRAPFTAPRNAYRSSDGRWLGLSASAQSIAERVMRIVGRPDLIDQPWFSNHTGRVAHVDELDAIIQDWIGARTADEVLAAFAEFEGAIAPMYTIEDIVCDPHFAARETIISVNHPALGPVRMPNVVPSLSDTPGVVRSPGADLGADNRAVFVDQLGLTAAEVERLTQEGVL